MGKEDKIEKQEEIKEEERIEESKLSEMDNKETSSVKGRIEKNILVGGNPSREKLLGRIEAFLQAGAIIDSKELVEIVKSLKLNKEECDVLLASAKMGVKQGTIQNPGDVSGFGERMKCFAEITSISMEKKI